MQMTIQNLEDEIEAQKALIAQTEEQIEALKKELEDT